MAVKRLRALIFHNVNSSVSRTHVYYQLYQEIIKKYYRTKHKNHERVSYKCYIGSKSPIENFPDSLTQHKTSLKRAKFWNKPYKASPL